MTAKEQVAWLTVLLWLWGTTVWCAMGYLLWGTEEAVSKLHTLIWILGPGTLLYLLILSWRLFYLKGVKG